MTPQERKELDRRYWIVTLSTSFPNTEVVVHARIFKTKGACLDWASMLQLADDTLLVAIRPYYHNDDLRIPGDVEHHLPAMGLWQR